MNYNDRQRRGNGARRRSQRQVVDQFHSGTDPISRRNVLLALFGGASALGFAKLASHQIFKREWNVQQADYRRRTEQVLFARRGTIYDRNGNVLTSSVDCANVYVNPQLIENKRKAVKALVEVLGVDEDACWDLVEGEGTFAYVKRRVDQDDCDLLAKKEIAGIEFEPTVKRVYPYGALASQVLGTVNVDNMGTSGLESYYEDVLHGVNGSINRERARDGSYIAGGAYKKVPAQDGVDMIITIDANIQRVAEEAMAEAVEKSGAKNGSVVVIEPTTGEILAACSNPTFNVQDTSDLRPEDMPLRSVTDAYEPGSVFKALVCGMALDLEKVTPDTEFDVPATVLVGDDYVEDVDERDYGLTMNVREIMRRSSNTGMVLIGEKIGADNFAKYLKKYCLGQSSGIDYPGESNGIVRDRKDYDGSSLGSMSFGQGIALAPIEVLRAMTGIANKGVMVTPHFLKSKKGEEVDWSDKDKRAISEKAAKQVVSMMETVVAEGTGSGAQIPGYRIAGKTGTAERASSEGGYLENNNMASFLGFVCPDHPKAMVYITLDGTAYSSGITMEPFRKIMQACIDSLGIKPDN